MERKKEKTKSDDDDDVAGSLVTDASGKRHSSFHESSQRTENAPYAHGETSKRGRDQQNHHSSDKRRRSSGGEQEEEGAAGLEVLAAAANSVRKTGGKKTPQSRSGGKIPVAIEQFDITTGKTIAEYDSQRAAERATNVDNGSISECVRGFASSAGGFGWREVGGETRTVPTGTASGSSSTSSKKPSSSSSSSDPSNQPNNRRLGKTAVSVQQYDLATGLTIGQFDSQRAAARTLGIDRNDICDCIQGKLPHAGFFGWRKITTGSSGDPPSFYSLIYISPPTHFCHSLTYTFYTNILLISEAAAADDDEDNEMDDTVICTCKRPPTGDAGRTIACENKKCPVEWYHYGCVGLTSEPSRRWLCPTCQPRPPAQQNRHDNNNNNNDDDDEQYNSDTVYCICRRPESGRMIACVNPHCAVEWYHLKCVGLTKNSTNLLSHKKWLCPSCKQDPAAAKYVTAGAGAGAGAVAGGSEYCFAGRFSSFAPLPHTFTTRPLITHPLTNTLQHTPSITQPLTSTPSNKHPPPPSIPPLPPSQEKPPPKVPPPLRLHPRLPH